MIEIKVPANPPGAPEQLFLASFIHFVDSEPRLAKPVSRAVVGIRLVEAAEDAKASGVIELRDEDHQLLCQLLETSEASFIPPLIGKNAAGEEVELPVNPRLVRNWVAAILSAKPIESLAAAAE